MASCSAVYGGDRVILWTRVWTPPAASNAHAISGAAGAGRHRRRVRRMLKLVGFEKDKALRLGVVDGDSVVDLQAVDPRVPSDLGRWLAENDGDLAPLGDIAKRAPSSARLPLANLTYALP